MKQLPFLRQPGYRLIAAGAINRFGDSIDTLAISWLIYRETGNPVLMGLLFAASFIPNLLLAPWAGVLADRRRKTSLSILCDLLRGGSTLFLGTCALLGWLPVWLPFVIILFNASCETFASPAKASLFPLLVPQDELLRLQGVSASASSVAELAGTASAGIILAFLGMPGAFAADALTFFASAFLTAGIRRHEPESVRNPASVTVGREFLSGVGMLLGHKRLLILSLMGALINFFLTPFNVLLPIFADKVSPLGAGALSLFGVSITIGIGIGGMVIAKLHRRIVIGWAVGGGLMAMAVGYGLSALAGMVMSKGLPATVAVAVALLLLGFSVPFMSAPISAYAMKIIPPEARGRYFSLMGMIALVGTPLGGLLSGIAARHVEPSTLFLAVSVCLFLLGLAYLIGDRLVTRREKGNTVPAV